MSKYFTEEQMKQVVDIMGEEVAKIYMNWAEQYVENHVNTWLENNGLNKNTVSELDEKRLEKYLATKFYTWYILYEGLED